MMYENKKGSQKKQSTVETRNKDPKLTPENPASKVTGNGNMAEVIRSQQKFSSNLKEVNNEKSGNKRMPEEPLEEQVEASTSTNSSIPKNLIPAKPVDTNFGAYTPGVFTFQVIENTWI